MEINVGKRPLNLRITAAAGGTKNGGKKMPRIRKTKVAKKKVKRKQQYPLLGVAGGQKGRLRIGDSELVVTRTPDKIRIRKMPQRQVVIHE